MIKKISFRQADVLYSVKGKGRAVVLIHGLLNSPDIFKPIVKSISEKFTSITIFLPGHGGSESPGYYCSMENMAILTDKIIKKEGFRTCTILGYSLGGYIALAYADLYPDKLKGLILCHTSPGKDSPRRIKERTKLSSLILQKKDMVIKTMNKSSGGSNEKFSAEGISALIKGVNKRRVREMIYQYSPVPILSVTGEKDTIAPPGNLEFIRSKKDRFRMLIVLKDKEHEGFIQDQEKLKEIIIKFISLSFRIKR